MTYSEGDVVKTVTGEIGTIVGPSAQVGYYNLKNEESGEEESIALKDIASLVKKKNGMSDYKHTALEVVSNGLNYAILQKIQGKSFLRSPRTHAFVISDAIYELIMKHWAEPYILDMLGMEAPEVAEDAFVQSGDFKDALKAIPITLLQQIYSRLFQKKGWTTDLMRNAVEAYIAIVVSNVDTRLIQKWVSGADKESRY